MHWKKNIVKPQKQIIQIQKMTMKIRNGINIYCLVPLATLNQKANQKQIDF